jgi:hypothetical protein
MERRQRFICASKSANKRRHFIGRLCRSGRRCGVHAFTKNARRGARRLARTTRACLFSSVQPSTRVLRSRFFSFLRHAAGACLAACEPDAVRSTGDDNGDGEAPNAAFGFSQYKPLRASCARAPFVCDAAQTQARVEAEAQAPFLRVPVRPPKACRRAHAVRACFS